MGVIVAFFKSFIFEVAVLLFIKCPLGIRCLKMGVFLLMMKGCFDLI